MRVKGKSANVEDRRGIPALAENAIERRLAGNGVPAEHAAGIYPISLPERVENVHSKQRPRDSWFDKLFGPKQREVPEDLKLLRSGKSQLRNAIVAVEQGWKTPPSSLSTPGTFWDKLGIR